MSAPPLLPSGLPTTSIAALPLVLESLSRGMYAISLQGSNNEYFEPLLKIFWAAPTKTDSIKGVVPSKATTGDIAPWKIFSAKKDNPVTPII